MSSGGSAVRCIRWFAGVSYEKNDAKRRIANMSGAWIPVTERLPEPDYMGNAVGVLACLPDGEVCIGFCDNDEYGVRWQCNSTHKPTHWMPLPATPNMGSGKPNMGSQLGSK